jgi:hypothetical protein
MELAKLVISLGSASIAGMAVYFFKDGRPVTSSSQLTLPLVFFVASVLYGAVFACLVVWRYELYCHDGNSYTRGWYAGILALGFSMLLSLAFGYAAFVWLLIHAIT